MRFAGRLRAASALASAARREAVADPVSALMLMAAIGVVHLAPAFQFHRLGEAGRLAREGGLSALLTAGTVFVAAGACRSVGGELERGIAAAALARPVSRPLFLAAKFLGIVMAFALFAAAVLAATILSALSCVAGSAAAGDDGTAKVSAFCLALGFGGAVLALVFAALRHRFAHRPFVPAVFSSLVASQVLALGLAFLSAPVREAAQAAAAWSPVSAAAAVFGAVSAYGAISAALSVRLRPAAVATFVGAALVLSQATGAIAARHGALAAVFRAVVPDFGAFWLIERASEGAMALWPAAVSALAAAAAVSAFWIAAGSALFARRDIP